MTTLEHLRRIEGRLTEFGSALRKRVSVDYVPGSAQATMRVGGVRAGRMSFVTRKDSPVGTPRSISYVEIDPRFRGLGLATKFYGEVARRNPAQAIKSDTAIMDTGVWSRMARKGKWKITENPRVDWDGVGAVAHGKAPVYVGRLPRKAATR